MIQLIVAKNRTHCILLPYKQCQSHLIRSSRLADSWPILHPPTSLTSSPSSLAGLTGRTWWDACIDGIIYSTPYGKRISLHGVLYEIGLLKRSLPCDTDPRLFFFKAGGCLRR